MGETMTLEDALASLTANEILDVADLDDRAMVGDTVRCFLAPVNFVSGDSDVPPEIVVVERNGDALEWFRPDAFADALAKKLGIVVR